MTCIVFGASGAIGRFLLPRLLAIGAEVVAVSRTPRSSAHRGLRWIEGDLPSGIPAWPKCDTIFSLGPLDAFAQWLDDHDADAAARVIAIGSMSAVTKARSSDSAERDLAARLLRAESSLAATSAARGGSVTLLRASLIYGAGVDRSLTPIVRFARRWRVFPLTPGARGLRQPVHAEDLAAACVALAALRGTPRASYDVGGGERLAFGTMLARVRASLGFATLPIPVPLSLARAAAGFAQRSQALPGAGPAALHRTAEDLVVDHAAAAHDFGWRPRDFRPTPQDFTPRQLP